MSFTSARVLSVERGWWVELGAKSPDVPSNTQGGSGVNELKLSFDLLIDMRLTTEQLVILFAFFLVVPKSEKRISMLSNCSDKSLAHQDFMAPSSPLLIYLR